jgi:chloramphenicol 3-O phosphotransferase
MDYDIMVLNGGSSSGKTGIARCMQSILPQPWLVLGVDTFLQLLPARIQGDPDGIQFLSSGEIRIGSQYRKVHAAWRQGVAAMARAGARILLDDVFLRSVANQRQWQITLHGLHILWVGVHCEAAIAEGRELARGDHMIGMARIQTALVHHDVHYDLNVDTTHTEALACAQQIAAILNNSPTLATP